MNLGLNGKVALVTGGGRDVGREIALALAQDGVTVAVNYNNSAAEAQGVVDEIVKAGGKARAYRANVGDYAAVRAMVDSIVTDFGRIDILINNAGVVIGERFVNSTPEQWARQIDVDLYGTIHTCHAVAPHMCARTAVASLRWRAIRPAWARTVSRSLPLRAPAASP